MTGLLRSFTCAVCGAPRKTTDDALLVLCAHCGSLLTHGTDGLWCAEAVAERHDKSVRDMLRPSVAHARLTRLALEMTHVVANGDLERWWIMAEEQLLLMAIVHPDHVAPLPRDALRRTRFVADALAVQKIATFDPNVRVLMSVYGSACAGLGRATDAVAVARAMLEAARAYYRALSSHLDFPPGALPEGAEHHARELVRGGVAGYASLVGAGVIETIRVQVLGDARFIEGQASCPKCGAPLDQQDLARCRHCGAVTRVDERADAWTEARLALWKITLAELVRREELDGPAPVIAAVGSFLYTEAADVPVDQAVAFLRRAIPWVTLADLARGLDLLGHAAGEKSALLEGIRTATSTWRADASGRPAAHPKDLQFPTPTEADETAWVESTLALWRYRKGGTPLDLLGHPLVTIHIAATMDKPAGVTPRAAMRFFEGAWPSFDRAAVLIELRKLQPGYDTHPRVAAFTAELARLLAT